MHFMPIYMRAFDIVRGAVDLAGFMTATGMIVVFDTLMSQTAKEVPLFQSNQNSLNYALL